MYLIKIKPSAKKLNFYSFHNGYELVRFSCKRKYYKSLVNHRKFLQQVLKHRQLQLIDSLMQKDLDSAKDLFDDILRVKQINSFNPYEVRRLNDILLGRQDTWNTQFELWQSEVNSMSLSELTEGKNELKKKRFKESLKVIEEREERRRLKRINKKMTTKKRPSANGLN